MSKSFFKDDHGNLYLMKIKYQNPFDKSKTNIISGVVAAETPDSLKVRDGNSGNLVLIWKKDIITVAKKDNKKSVEPVSSSVKNKYQDDKQQGTFSDNFSYSKWWKNEKNLEEVDR